MDHPVLKKLPRYLANFELSNPKGLDLCQDQLPLVQMYSKQ